MRRALIVLLLVAAGLFAAQRVSAAPECTVTWDGPAAGNWVDEDNWDTNVVPGSGDVVCIPALTTVTYSGTTDIAVLLADGTLALSSGTLTLTDTANDSHAAGFDQSGGTLTGAATIVLTNGGRWGGGTMAGAGETIVPAGKTLTLDNFTVTLSDARVLDNLGTILFATIDRGIQGFGTARVVNEGSGVIRKTVGSSTTAEMSSFITAPVENDGKVESVAALGRLVLSDGSGGSSTGTYGSAGAAGEVELAGSSGHELGTGAKLLGGAVIDGAVDAAGTVTAANARMDGGTLGGAGVLSITGPFRWAGGTMAETGRTVVQAGQTMTLDNFTVTLSDARVLDNLGTILFATIDRGIQGFGTARVVNEGSGVIRKTVGSSTTAEMSSFITAPVENDGKVESVAALGRLVLSDGSGGSSTGTYGSAGAAGEVELAGSSGHELGTGAKLLGGAVIDGAVDAAGTVTAANARMDGGTLGGAGVLSITGPFRWAGGTMAETGRTVVQAGQTLTLDNFTVTLSDARVLDNLGTILFATIDRGIQGFGTARVVNEGSGVIRKTVGSSTATTMRSFITAPVENDGQVRSTAALGALVLSNGSGGTSTGSYGSAGAAGEVQITGSSVHTFGDGAALLAGAVISGSAMTIPAGATVTAAGAAMSGGTLGGAGTLAVTSGTFAWSGGTMNGSGLLRVDGGATTRITASVTLADTRRADIAGTMALASDNTIGFSQTALIHVLAGGALRKTIGTATGSSVVFVPVQNDGTVETVSGKLQLSRGSGLPESGTFKGHSATQRLLLSGDDHVLTAAARLEDFTEIAGGVTVRAGDTLPVAGEIYETVSGELSGDVDLTGTLHWEAGELVGPGTMTVRPAGRIVLDDSCFAANLRDGYRLVNQGTISLLAHSVLEGFGDEDAQPVLENAGRIAIDDTAAGDCDTSGISSRMLVHNTGTIEKLGGTGEAQMSGTLDNDGTILVSKGTMTLDTNADVADIEQTGTFTSAPGASYTFRDGVFALAAGAAVSGSPGVSGAELRLLDGVTVTVPAGGTLTHTDGSISGAGTLRILGALDWRGGDETGPGTTVIEPGATVAISPAAGEDSGFVSLEASRALVNKATMTVTDSELGAFDGAAILNRGVIELSGASNLGGGSFGGGFAGLLHNVGTLRKTGTSTVELGIPTDNDGTIEVAGGILDARQLLNATEDFGDAALVDGTYVVRAGASLGVPSPLATLAGHVVLDGAGSKLVVTDFDETPEDAIAGLRRIAGNGELELSGGRSLASNAAEGTFTNAGVLGLGAGSTFTAAGGYAQTAGAVLRSAIPATGAPGRVTTTGAAALAGRLDVVSPSHPPAGTDVTVVGYGSHTGTFAQVTGASGFAVRYDADGVKLNVSSSLADRPAEPVAAPPAPPATVEPPATERLTAAALTVRGPWARRGAYLVAKRKGATLVRRAVRGRGVDVVAATCRRCGSVKVSWAGKSRTISLRARRAHRRTFRVARLARPRTGRLVVRTTSARRVAVAAVLVRR